MLGNWIVVVVVDCGQRKTFDDKDEQENGGSFVAKMKIFTLLYYTWLSKYAATVLKTRFNLHLKPVNPDYDSTKYVQRFP